MKVLCTFPGKNGDLLWALPTVRALSRRVGEPVHLQIPGALAGIADLVLAQPYIQTTYVATDWQVENTAPVSPREPPATIDIQQDLTLHLGYRGWPQRPLPFETLDCLNHQSMIAGSKWTRFGVFHDEELALHEPWITVPHHDNFSNYHWPWVYGFTDEYFELKYGLVELLRMKRYKWPGILPPLSVGANDRWRQEAGEAPMSWLESAALIKQSTAFLGCCSALHVLAVAIGTPAIIMEPQQARWQGIFWPLETLGPQVTLVRGGDNRPTWDARHVAAALMDAILRHHPSEHLSAQNCGCDMGLKDAKGNPKPHYCDRHAAER